MPGDDAQGHRLGPEARHLELRCARHRHAPARRRHRGGDACQRQPHAGQLGRLDHPAQAQRRRPRDAADQRMRHGPGRQHHAQPDLRAGARHPAVARDRDGAGYRYRAVLPGLAGVARDHHRRQCGAARRARGAAEAAGAGGGEAGRRPRTARDRRWPHQCAGATGQIRHAGRDRAAAYLPPRRRGHPCARHLRRAHRDA
ncbi:hypothetical protein D3C72_1519370 [compost metagenome]